MSKMRLILLLAVVVLLSAAIFVSTPIIKDNQVAQAEGASDFHQRHPEWTWSIPSNQIFIPVTGEMAFPDYHQRHPQVREVDTTDYYFRHP